MRDSTLFACVAGACLGGLLVPATPAAASPLNLLFFGNSFSQQGVNGDALGNNNDVPSIVARAAVADGLDAPVVVKDLAGGTDLDRHIGRISSAPASNVNASAIQGKTFDYVVMQGYSTEATATQGDGTFTAGMRGLFSAVRSNAYGTGAGTKGILYQTWARAPGNSGFYPIPYTDAADMQAEVRSGYADALAGVLGDAGTGAARIAPVGDAFEALGFATSLYDSDLYHASDTGSLLAGLVLYRSIYGEDVSDISFAAASTAGLYAGSSTTWATLTATVDDVVAVPEPGTAVTFGTLAAAGLLRRRRPGA